MEMSQAKHKASKIASEDLDYISSMPDDVVTNILDRLPIQNAVGTSILSTNWRFKWTLLSQLVFDEEFSKYLSYGKYKNDYDRIISRFLFSIKGAITKFVVRRFNVDQYYDAELAHWILFLSRKGVVKDLTISELERGDTLDLPSHIFLCSELKYLKLFNCFFLHRPISFPNLLGLELGCVLFLSSFKFGDLFTQCPVLEILNLGYTDFQRQVKLVEIAKLTNLKALTLFMCNLHDTPITSRDIFELVGFLPKLQELNLDFIKFETFTEDGFKKRSPTTFLCLKSLSLSTISLKNDVMLSFAFELIRSSLNLQTLEIIVGKQHGVAPPATFSLETDYNTMETLQLRSVVFKDLKGSENEVCLIKYLLACSPFLKKIVIHPRSSLSSGKKLMFAKKLLMLDRASPVAKIDLL